MICENCIHVDGTVAVVLESCCTGRDGVPLVECRIHPEKGMFEPPRYCPDYEEGAK